jgi:hypothetical protein
MKAERAWRIPYEIQEHFGSIKPKDLAERKVSEFAEFFKGNNRLHQKLHRFPDKMALNISKANYPGLLDYGAFRIGRNWCKPTNPLCDLCYLRQYCAFAGQHMAAR